MCYMELGIVVTISPERRCRPTHNPDVTKISLFTAAVAQCQYLQQCRGTLCPTPITQEHIVGFVVAGLYICCCWHAAAKCSSTEQQRDCTLSIGFEGREAYPRVHRDNKSKYCATPLRLNPRHYRHQSRVGRLDLSPSTGPRS